MSECVVRVDLPAHLRTLAGLSGEARVIVSGEVTLCAVLDALEGEWPALRGTIRDQATGRRRAFLRFFAAEEDLSSGDLRNVLPASVAEGREALLVIGAIAGG